MSEHKTFARRYRELLRCVLQHGIREKNARTGKEILIIDGGASFKINLSDGILPTCGMRLTKPYIAAAELAWCLLGHDHINWLRKHTKVWDQFATEQICGPCEGDGFFDYHRIAPCTNCFGTGKSMDLTEAYGNRWRNAFDRDQLQHAINALEADPTDRRIWISSWDPRVDGLGAEGQKTVPCPVGFTFSIVNDRLNSTFVIRSSDLFMGLPYDVMRHAYLMATVASTLGTGLGIMQVSIAHPHLYDQHVEAAREMIDTELNVPYMKLPLLWDIDRIVNVPDSFVEKVKAQTAGFQWPKEFKGEVVR